MNGRAAVHLGAGDMALLDAQRSERLQAVGHDAKIPCPPRAAAPRRRARNRSRNRPRRRARRRRRAAPPAPGCPPRCPARTPMNGRAASLTSMSSQRLLEQRPAVRPRDGRPGPMVGQRGERHFQLRPGDREQHFEMLIDERGAGRGGGHQVARSRRAARSCRRRRESRRRAASARSAPCRRGGWRRCWCRRGRGRVAASGPCTSILPSVETSVMPTEARTARASRT